MRVNQIGFRRLLYFQEPPYPTRSPASTVRKLGRRQVILAAGRIWLVTMATLDAPIPDALIIGGGPAGSTAARLLAQWGHSVAILTAPPGPHTLGECLPPSTQKVFQFLGIQDAIDAAGFFRTAGNTVWWGRSGRRVEPYPDGLGYQVFRRDFDLLLLDLAQSAGVRVHGPGDSPRARFTLDCSGRAGVIARAYRVRPKNVRTVALCGVWRNDGRWKLPDTSHTLVEAYRDGWAWSVPLSPSVRHVAFMVDPVETKLVRGNGLARAYLAEMAKTRSFRRIFAQATLKSGPWGCDASPYTSRQYCGPGFLLAGDAGSFIDPLSSFGVKKAMVSAWAAAVVANTCLRRPGMQQTALEFFDERERQIAESYRNQSSGWSRAASRSDAQPFWSTRSGADAQELVPDAGAVAARAALDDLRRQPAIHLRRAEGVVVGSKAGIEGREIVLRDALTVPGIDAPIDFIANVDVPKLVEIASHHRQVPDLFEAYNRIGPAVDLPHFLTALADLVARRILVNR
jgi:flavin-dependent dehydrogenase